MVSIMSNAIKGHESELPFAHYVQLNDSFDKIEVKSCPPNIIIKDKKYYQLLTTRTTGDHEFTYYYNPVDCLSLDI